MDPDALHTNVGDRMEDTVVTLFSVIAAECRWNPSLSDDVERQDLA